MPVVFAVSDAYSTLKFKRTDSCIHTKDIRKELLIVLELDIHVGHDKNSYILV